MFSTRKYMVISNRNVEEILAGLFVADANVPFGRIVTICLDGISLYLGRLMKIVDRLPQSPPPSACIFTVILDFTLNSIAINSSIHSHKILDLAYLNHNSKSDTVTFKPEEVGVVIAPAAYETGASCSINGQDAR